MLYYLDLTPSLNMISRSRLLEKLEPLIGNKYTNSLVSSFLSSPILDEDGRDWSAHVGIPSGGLLTLVLFHFFLDNWDRAFYSLFPNFRYVRYIHESFVPTLIRSASFFFSQVRVSSAVYRFFHFSFPWEKKDSD